MLIKNNGWKVGYKVVKITNYKRAQSIIKKKGYFSVFSSLVIEYKIGKKTKMPWFGGYLAIFENLKNASNFIRHSISYHNWKNGYFTVFKCEYMDANIHPDSMLNKLFYMSTKNAKINAVGTIEKIPEGTVLTKIVKLIEEVKIEGYSESEW